MSDGVAPNPWPRHSRGQRPYLLPTRQRFVIRARVAVCARVTDSHRSRGAPPNSVFCVRRPQLHSQPRHRRMAKHAAGSRGTKSCFARAPGRPRKHSAPPPLPAQARALVVRALAATPAGERGAASPTQATGAGDRPRSLRSTQPHMSSRLLRQRGAAGRQVSPSPQARGSACRRRQSLLGPAAAGPALPWPPQHGSG